MEKANNLWPDKVTICEVGLRDGLQNEKKIVSLEEKLQLLHAVVAAGIKVIEVGSFVHPKAVPAMADTDKLVQAMEKVDGVEYRVLVPNLKGVERAFAAGLSKVKLTVSASEAHCINNFNKKPLEMMEAFTSCVDFVAQHNMEVSGAISTSFGCPFQGKVPVEQVENVVRGFLKLGITELSLSDTTGMANPRQVFELGSHMKKTFPQVKWVMHFHNTRDMALANIVAGMQAGITVFDGAFAGLGGCPFAPGASGNVATEDVIHMLHEMGIDTGIDLEKAIVTARLAEQMVGHQTGGAVLKAGRCEDLTKQQAQRQNNK
ncbi:hydroxymethylglutaryl-CoA lyase [Sporomusa acidovorans]|uniref:Hydroxymethylglutaryl-CoA lyase YngG n=1 Tax=Sporomusa acidovorans (strain ATCC 49682 / DSM 3132 / Mol) TaxID=1123286 RepID=A0ABZ3J5Q9_SPOA4|nr:hydroxymethylglutaryl-CoA lyase [Sporomusa acidovorans]OZC19691.1 hydroxymethylglutaryl-CoA lyase YngG [Sporomusa acidovorans DSM 3132]SDF72275.1 hydroxymethylglutaryl-CoA lyase [Sporomusa acidovorans]